MCARPSNACFRPLGGLSQVNATVCAKCSRMLWWTEQLTMKNDHCTFSLDTRAWPGYLDSERRKMLKLRNSLIIGAAVLLIGCLHSPRQAQAAAPLKITTILLPAGKVLS